MFKRLEINDGDTLILEYNTSGMWDLDMIGHTIAEIEKVFPKSKVLAIPDTMFTTITVSPGSEEQKSFF